MGGKSGEPEHLRYKKAICWHWKEKGDCWHGDACHFAHGQKELRADVPFWNSKKGEEHLLARPKDVRARVYGSPSPSGRDIPGLPPSETVTSKHSTKIINQGVVRELAGDASQEFGEIKQHCWQRQGALRGRPWVDLSEVLQNEASPQAASEIPPVIPGPPLNSPLPGVAASTCAEGMAGVSARAEQAAAGRVAKDSWGEGDEGTSIEAVWDPVSAEPGSLEVLSTATQSFYRDTAGLGKQGGGAGDVTAGRRANRPAAEAGSIRGVEAYSFPELVEASGVDDIPEDIPVPIPLPSHLPPQPSLARPKQTPAPNSAGPSPLAPAKTADSAPSSGATISLFADATSGWLLSSPPELAPVAGAAGSPSSNGALATAIDPTTATAASFSLWEGYAAGLAAGSQMQQEQQQQLAGTWQPGPASGAPASAAGTAAAARGGSLAGPPAPAAAFNWGTACKPPEWAQKLWADSTQQDSSLAGSGGSGSIWGASIWGAPTQPAPEEGDEELQSMMSLLCT